MGSVPNHPFWLHVIENLQSYDRNWGLPYVTIMYSTGPLFLSVIWKQWISSGRNVGDGLDGGRVRILRQTEFNKHPWSFFNTFMGSSWHKGDVAFLFWVQDNWVLLLGAGAGVVASVALVAWWAWTRIGAYKSLGEEKGSRWLGWRGWGRRSGYATVPKYPV